MEDSQKKFYDNFFPCFLCTLILIIIIIGFIPGCKMGIDLFFWFLNLSITTELLYLILILIFVTILFAIYFLAYIWKHNYRLNLHTMIVSQTNSELVTQV